MQRVAIVSIEGMTESDYQSLLPCVSEERRLRLSALKNPVPRFHSLVGEVLAQYLLSEVTGRKLGTFTIERFTGLPRQPKRTESQKHLTGLEQLTGEHLESGKPFQRTVPGVFFNVSHSGNLVAGVAADAPVGIDVQTLIQKPERLMKTILCEEEMQLAATLEAEALKQYCTRVWCRKESYVKMDGRGISLPFRDINSEQLLREGSSGQSLCRIEEEEVQTGYYIAVCISNRKMTVRT